MAFTPIPHGTLNWDVLVNAAFEALWSEVSGASFYRLVAAADAPASVRAKAQYVCDGSADDVQIQQAVNDVKTAGGGIVQLSGGNFNLAATVTISGNADEDDADTITLRGVGAQATTLDMAADVNGIELTNWAMANIASFGVCDVAQVSWVLKKVSITS